jgi:hypothetical protein
MRNSRIIAGLLLASCLVAAPASAAGLLGNALGGSGGGLLSGVTSGASSALGGITGGSAGGVLSSVTGGATGGLLGGTSTPTGTSTGVPGVATASVNSTGTGTTAHGTLLNGGGSTLNLGLHGVLGDNSQASLTLPSTGIGAVDNLTGSLTGTVNGLTGNGGTVDSTVGGLTGGLGGGLLGGLGNTLGGLTGGNDPAGTTTTRTGGGLGGLPVGTNRGFFSFGGGSLSIAGFGGAACAGQDPRAIGRLLQSRSYNRGQLNSWHRAANVQVVPIRLCSQLRAAVRQQLAGNNAVAMVQNLAAADPLISTSLSRTRYGAGNVLAVDQANGTLTVYVY